MQIMVSYIGILFAFVCWLSKIELPLLSVLDVLRIGSYAAPSPH